MQRRNIHKHKYLIFSFRISHFCLRHTIIDFLPKIIRKLIELVIYIVLLLFVTFVLLKSVLGFAILEYRMVSTAMQVPMQYIYFSMIILFGLLILSFVMEILYQVKEILSSKGEKG